MPNWCINGLEVQADEVTRNEFLEAVTRIPAGELGNSEQEAYILENLVPRPDEEDDNWYQWSLDNWGTKWADDCTEVVSADDELKFVFSTAWSPPCAGVINISKLYPAATFFLTWEESGLCFIGGAAYRDGVLLHEVNIEGKEYPSFDGDDFSSVEYVRYCGTLSDIRVTIELELFAAAL